MTHFDYSWGPNARMRAPKPMSLRKVPAKLGLVIEETSTGWVGAITRCEKIGGQMIIELEDRHQKVRSFPLGFGFLLEGESVELVQPSSQKQENQSTGRLRSASGSVVVENLRAQKAKESRIWVEGKHDAELVEKVWGHDLRVEGIVVEPLHGVDDLPRLIQEFAPSPKRRLGILVDHLVMGSKETRIREEAMRTPGAAGNVLIVGHPYVDVWQTVKPSALGLRSWPNVPKGEDWKTGILRGIGWPYKEQSDVAEGWQKILGKVRHYGDLEPSLLARVEEVIDFVTVNEP